MSFKLYYDFLSQPSRALYILFKTAKIPFQPISVDLKNGAHFSEDFEKINRFKKVPVIEHNGFILTESVAIVQYLREMKLLPETLFPSDIKLQARVNEYLSWQQFGIRAPCALYFMLLVTDPMITGEQPSQKRVDNQMKKTVTALDMFEDKWLGNGHKFLLGDTLTVADLFGCCEIEQPRMAGYDPKKGRPNITAWMERVRSELNPYYDEAHTIVNKIAKKREAGSSKL